MVYLTRSDMIKQRQIVHPTHVKARGLFVLVVYDHISYGKTSIKSQIDFWFEKYKFFTLIRLLVLSCLLSSFKSLLVELF